ncbi:HAD hydrolase-like protein [Achromobacter aegrifaciens]
MVDGKNNASAWLRNFVEGQVSGLARTVMVGDADTDVRAPTAAGAPLTLVHFGYSEVSAVELKPDILLRRFDELVDACAALLKVTNVVDSAPYDDVAHLQEICSQSCQRIACDIEVLVEQTSVAFDGVEWRCLFLMWLFLVAKAKKVAQNGAYSKKQRVKSHCLLMS